MAGRAGLTHQEHGNIHFQFDPEFAGSWKEQTS